MADPKTKLGRVAKASTSIPGLIVVGSAAVGAAALHSMPILLLGGVAYGALVAWDLVSGGSKGSSSSGSSTSSAGEDTTPRLMDPSEYQDPATQASVRAILGAKIEIDRVLGDTPPDVQANLSLALASIDELEQRAAKLALRSDDIAKYLSTMDPRVVQQDVETLARTVSQTRDPEARTQYEHAHAARRELQQTLQDLSAARERIHATMLSIGATLEGLPAKIVRMRALDAHAMDQLTGDVKEELDRMNGEIRTFEETLKSLGEVNA
jgi:chromosome segregation ATPase